MTKRDRDREREREREKEREREREEEYHLLPKQGFACDARREDCGG